VNIGLANEFARYADKTGIDIYKVIERVRVNGQVIEKVIYVGKTEQDLRKRLRQHLKDPKKPDWRATFAAGDLRIEPIKAGNWTAYEAAVWERHYIKHYEKLNPDLLNDATPIGERKFNKFRDLHIPCP